MKKLARRTVLIIMLLLLPLLFSACGEKNPYRVYTFNLSDSFNTVNKVQIVSREKPQAELDALYDELDQILIDLDHRFNIQDRGDGIITEQMRINQNAGIAPLAVSDEMITVLKKALEMSELSLSGGVALFDPSIAPVWDVWDFVNNLYDPFMDNRAEIPTAEQITARLPLVDYTKIIIDETAKTVFLQDAGMKIDLGAIVKGYAADQLKAHLVAKGYDKAVIDVGRNILLLGDGVDVDGANTPWKVSIQTPFVSQYDGSDLQTYGSMKLTDVTVVTSGTYEKYIMDESGNMYPHILDPRTGYPFDNGVIGVTVVCSESIVGDGFSTTLFALGIVDGMALVNSLDYLDAVWVVENGTSKEIYVSDGLKDLFVFNEAVTEIGFVYKGAYNENFGN